MGILSREDFLGRKMRFVGKGLSHKYPLTDIYKNLKGQEVEFRLMAELMPIIGPITRTEIGRTKSKLPAEYYYDKVAREQRQNKNRNNRKKRRKPETENLGYSRNT